MAGRERLRRSIEKRYREELRRLSSYWPAEEVTLEDLARGRQWVTLQSGERHFFSGEEVEKLLSRVPFYFHRHMRVPVRLRYVRDRSGGRYVVLGDAWQRRLVEILLRGEYSFEGLSVLSVSDFMRLVGEYRSLVFVSVTL